MRAKVKNPILFSTYFGVTPKDLAEAGLIDPLLDVDTPLFIDPILLESSSNQLISKQAIQRFRNHFQQYVRLLAISENEGDAAWKAARQQLNLREPPENGLGYGGSGRSGSSRPEDIRERIMRTTKEVVTLGSRDPEMISLMGFFEDDVGADTISDFTTRVIIEDLAMITESFCRKHKIPVSRFPICEAELPKFISGKGKEVPLVLVPRDIVRDLPIAIDQSGIVDVALQNAHLRGRVNTFLGEIAKPTVADKKDALRRIALTSKEDFTEFLSAIREHTDGYNPFLDEMGYYRAKELIAYGLPGLKREEPYELKSPQDILRVVYDAIEVFKRHVEKGNLWELLWAGDNPKKERASQLIFFGIADAFCKQNNTEISPEANMGGGPVDFKFSHGYASRVLVEMKRSSGSVVHGYEKQLEFYKDASQTDYAVFVIIDYGDLGNKLETIEGIRTQRLAQGLPASDIVVIDARKKLSASKRD